jgi:hypothetical protein
MAYHTNHKDAKKVALAAYPNYKGRKLSIKVANNPLDVRSYWSEGSRDHFVFLRLDNLKTYEIPSQSMYDTQMKNVDNVQLVPGMICVEHSYFCGKDMGITIHVHPDNAPNLLPNNNTELTRDEKIVLVYTRSLKNTYGGETNLRFKEAKRKKSISLEQWENAVKSLQNKKMLTKAKSITIDGKNIIRNMNEYEIQ